MSEVPEAFSDIATAAALASGGTFQPVLCQDEGIARWLGRWLEAQDWRVTLHLPRGEEWAALADTLIGAERADRTLHLVFSASPPTAASRRGLSVFNLRRDAVLPRLPNLLLWCGPQAMLDASQEAMPDVWSMRETTLRIEVRAGPLPPPLRTWFAFREGNLDRLRDTCYDALRRGDPEASALSLLLAEGHAAVGDIANARRLVLELLRRDPVEEAAVLFAELALVEREAELACSAIARFSAAAGPDPLPAQAAALRRRVAMVRGTAALVQGTPDPALFDAVAEEFRSAGDSLGAARAHAAAGDARAVAGDLAGAERDLDAAMRAFVALGEREWEAAAAHALADLLGHQRRSAAAEEHYRLALALRLPPDPAVRAGPDTALAATLAERFPDGATLRRLCLEAGVVLPGTAEGRAGWSAAVEAASREGRLGTLRRLAGLDPSPPTSTPRPAKPSFHLPVPSLGDRLVGRADTLARLQRALADGPTTRLGKVVAVAGLGGLGKTQLVADFAAQHRRNYPGGIYWFEADADLDTQLGQLSARAAWTVPEAESSWKIQSAKDRLREAEDALLIFDNVEDLRRIAELLIGGPARRHVLLISRSAQPGFPTLPIGPLDPADAEAVLARTAGRGPEGAAPLLGLLGGHPLMLEMVGVWLRDHPGVSFAESAARIAQQGLAAPELAGEGLPWVSLTGHTGNLRATLRIQEGLLGRPGCRALVDLLAWSAPVAMGFELLRAALGVESTALRTTLDELGAAQVVRAEAEGGRFGMHRLVAAVRREDAPPDREAAGPILDRVVRWFRDRKEDWRDLAAFEAELDHLVAWRALAAELGWPEAEVRLWWLAAYPSFHRGKPLETDAILAEAWRLYELHALQVPLLEADLCLDRGATAYALGRNHEALSLSERALSLRRTHLPPGDLEIARAQHNVGSGLAYVGRASEGLENLRQAWSVLSTSAPFDAIWCADLCDALGVSEPVERAERLLRDAEPRIVAVLGERHPKSLQVRNRVAGVQLQKRRVARAKEMHEQIVQDARAILGSQHHRTGFYLWGLGIALTHLQDPTTSARAVEIFAEALHITLASCGNNEHHTVVTLIRADLARVLHSLNQTAHALKVLTPALRAHPPGSPVHDELEKLREQIQPRPKLRL